MGLHSALPTTTRQKFALIALDVDGTLLDGAGELAPDTLDAIRYLEQSGSRVVLCTGRRFRRAADAAIRAGLTGPIVCNSGALVKDLDSEATLWRADFDLDVLQKTLAVFRAADRPVVGFCDRRLSERDFRVARYPIGDAAFDEYVKWNRAHADIDANWERTAMSGLSEAFHVCAIGTRPQMIVVERAVHASVPKRVRTFVQRSPRYEGWMCEVMPVQAGKWAALCEVARRWRIPPAQICAIGDDVNDAPMISAAGLGVAMPHAPDEVKAVAARVIETTLAAFLRELPR